MTRNGNPSLRSLFSDSLLGGYLVAEAGNEQRENKDIEAFLRCYIDSTGAPLIHHDDERWQDGIRSPIP